MQQEIIFENRRELPKNCFDTSKKMKNAKKKSYEKDN